MKLKTKINEFLEKKSMHVLNSPYYLGDRFSTATTAEEFIDIIITESESIDATSKSQFMQLVRNHILRSAHSVMALGQDRYDQILNRNSEITNEDLKNLNLFLPEM